MIRYLQATTLFLTGLIAGTSRYLLFDGNKVTFQTQLLAFVAAIGIAAALTVLLLPLMSKEEEAE